MPDGRHDFDFIHGRWTVHHRRLTDRLDPACDTWETSTGTGVAEPVLDGIGNLDRVWSADIEGLTLRLYDPGEDLWRIWWSSTARPGRLDPPMQGRFGNGVGVFHAEDVIDGVPIAVRFDWTRTDTPSPRWSQAFSFDGGETYKSNWTMDFEAATA